MRNVISVSNQDLSTRAIEAARAQNKRLTNWATSWHSKRDRMLGEFSSEKFQYRGQFKGYAGYYYHALYTSRLTLENRRATYRFGFVGQMRERVLRAPAGTEWDRDGSLVLSSDYRIEFHPQAEDLLARDFARRVKAALRDARIKRVEADAREREQNRVRVIVDRELPTCRVLMEDSRRAGNCVEGTLQFCERVLRIERNQASTWLFSVPASRVLGLNDRAAAAARCAFERETTTSI